MPNGETQGRPHRARVLACILYLPVSVGLAQQRANDSTSDEARTLIATGISFFRAARYVEASESFSKAVALEPGNTEAHHDLATAYSVQVVPDLQTPENQKIASLALAEFDILRKSDPQNISILLHEAAVYRNIGQIEKAKALDRDVVGLDPKNAEALYTIGTLDWQEAYKNAVTVLAREGLSDDGAGNTKLSNSGCDVLERLNAALVDDAVTSLTQAIQVKPNYDDAMQYLNLIYRRHAELHCHDRQAATADIMLAQQWNDRAMRARKENETRVLR